MNDPFFVLLVSAATLGTFHTAIGVDHTIPFIVLSRARGWKLQRTLAITLTCGLGHVLSSVVIATLGLTLGIAGSRLAAIEDTRGTWAAWLLVGFGLAYAAVAWWKSHRRQLATPLGEVRSAGHHHAMGTGRVMSALFVVFVLGPCEALLPLLTASGMTLSLKQSLIVTVVFCAATIATMLTLVTLGYLGASISGIRKWSGRWEKHSHALAGLALALSGLSIQVLGI